MLGSVYVEMPKVCCDNCYKRRFLCLALSHSHFRITTQKLILITDLQRYQTFRWCTYMHSGKRFIHKIKRREKIKRRRQRRRKRRRREGRKERKKGRKKDDR